MKDDTGECIAPIAKTTAYDLRDPDAAARFMSALAGDIELQYKAMEILRLVGDDAIDVHLDDIDFDGSEVDDSLARLDPEVVEEAQDLCAKLEI